MTCPFSSKRGILGGSVLLAALALAACGGGDSGGSVDSAQPGATTGASVPPAAADSVGSFVTYQKSLNADDQSEPLLLNGFRPPVDDHAEPFPIG